MKNIIGLAAVALLLFGCSRKEDVTIEEIKRPVQMEFSARMDDGSLTKTTLEGSGTSSDRRVLWSPLDSIKISTGGAFTRFVYRGESFTDNATFRGTITEGNMYYAVYPASASVSMSEGSLSVSLPTTQHYVAESFDNGAYPMLAKSESTELSFQNLCGMMVLNLKGSVTISKISFEAEDASSAAMPVAGAGTVDMSYTDEPALVMTTSGEKLVVLDCGNGVALNEDSATPFYIALPPATYSSITLNIYTTDSRLMTKTATNLTVARSRGIVTSALTFSPNSGTTDLSAAGTANCYIVTRNGNFSFDASVIGNGDAGLLPQYTQDVKNFHTTSASITPASAQVLWQDVAGLVSNVSVSSGRISFTTSAAKGNAVIAAYSGEECTGNIIWSWHIWCTDQPQGEEYRNHINRRFVVLDRNLGATAANPGSSDEELLATYGVLYQWGRKDPFPGSASVSSTGEKTLYGVVTTITKVSTSSDLGTIENVVKNPAVYYYNNSSPYDWYYGSSRNGYLWGNPFGYNSDYITYKSIYDPCPVGYMVAPRDTWTGFTTTGSDSQTRNEFNVESSFSNGWSFYTSAEGAGNVSWYPMAGKRGYDSGVLATSGDYWNSNSSTPRGLGIGSSKVGGLSDSDRSNAYSVRCVQEFSSMLVSAPILTTVEPTDIAFTTATSGGNITSDGGADVTARGVCWSTSPNPLITDNHTSDGTGTGTFTSSLTGLDPGATYYLRSYATSQVGTNYGTHYTFTTQAFATVLSLSVVCNSNTTAVGRGNVTDAGDIDITERGICWSTSENPTISDSKASSSATGLGIFSVNMTELTPGTTYYMRAYAANSESNACSYGDNIMFVAGIPAVTTTAITDIAETTATGGGSTTFEDDITACGVCWSTSSNPTISDSKTEDTASEGAFTSYLTGLSDNTTYYVRAYVTTESGTGYGPEVYFTTMISGYTNLSASGTANCYIIPASGNYLFNASVIGNGAAGLLPSVAQSVKNFHTESPSISPLSAKVLWEEVTGMITSVAMNGTNVSFTASSDKGNALIAVYDTSDPDADGANILWSWHIWLTDTPSDENYLNWVDREFTLMDRNLGATAALPGSDVTATYGLHYQWGRKDPFRRDGVTISSTNSSNGTIANTIANPFIFYYNNSYPYNWLYNSLNYYLWGNPTGYSYDSDYTAYKTVYDPCPSGYMIAPKDTWTGFTTTGTYTETLSQFNVSGTFSNGWAFYNSAQGSGTTSWYPAAGYRDFNDGSLGHSGSYGRYWSSSPSSSGSNSAGDLYFLSGYVDPLNYGYRANGFSVRCLRVLQGGEFNNFTISSPSLGAATATEVTQSQAKIGGEVTNLGGAQVTARGVVYSTSQNFDTASGTDVPNTIPDGTNGKGSFTVDITGLTTGVTYYCRAYATNSAGTSYSAEFSFTTSTASGDNGDDFNNDDDKYEW